MDIIAGSRDIILKAKNECLYYYWIQIACTASLQTYNILLFRYNE